MNEEVFYCNTCGGDEYNCFCAHVVQPCTDNPQPCGCTPCCCPLCQGSCIHTWAEYAEDTKGLT